jgi:hypothetical protein
VSNVSDSDKTNAAAPKAASARSPLSSKRMCSSQSAPLLHGNAAIRRQFPSRHFLLARQPAAYDRTPFG